ncbi:MAG: hypothetical protein ABEJ68_09055 [Halobacteriaceae archaeon]
MPFKASGTPTEFEVIDRWDGGVGWVAHPEETMRRASHALATDEGVWLLDPLDAPGLDELLAEYGEVAGVVVTVDRHGRDAATLANRHDVAVHVPTSVPYAPDAPVEYVHSTVGDTDYRLVETVSVPGWREVALFDGETLVVGDAMGTAGHFVAATETLGVHPFLRLSPPRGLRSLAPERILVGHGEGVMADATATLESALDGARRNFPRAMLGALRALL